MSGPGGCRQASKTHHGLALSQDEPIHPTEEQMKDYTETAKRIARGEVVMGTWDDPAGEPLTIFIKGRHQGPGLHTAARRDRLRRCGRGRHAPAAVS